VFRSAFASKVINITKIVLNKATQIELKNNG